MVAAWTHSVWHPFLDFSKFVFLMMILGLVFASGRETARAVNWWTSIVMIFAFIMLIILHTKKCIELTCMQSSIAEIFLRHRQKAAKN